MSKLGKGPNWVNRVLRFPVNVLNFPGYVIKAIKEHPRTSAGIAAALILALGIGTKIYLEQTKEQPPEKPGLHQPEEPGDNGVIEDGEIKESTIETLLAKYNINYNDLTPALKEKVDVAYNAKDAPHARLNPLEELLKVHEKSKATNPYYVVQFDESKIDLLKPKGWEKYQQILKENDLRHIARYLDDSNSCLIKAGELSEKDISDIDEVINLFSYGPHFRFTLTVPEEMAQGYKIPSSVFMLTQPHKEGEDPKEYLKNILDELREIGLEPVRDPFYDEESRQFKILLKLPGYRLLELARIPDAQIFYLR